MKTETRAVEIRFEADAERMGPGRLVGVLMPYETRASDRNETFQADSLHWEDEGVLLREQHNRQAPIVRFKPVVEGKEVRVSIPLPDTQRGRDAAVSVRNGTLRGLSVEFQAERERMDGNMRVIERARLVGAGLVDSPSYAGSGVEVRAKGGRRRLWL